MDSPYQDYRNVSLHEGINTRLNGRIINDQEATELVNVDVNVPGRRVKRLEPGVVADFNPVPVPPVPPIPPSGSGSGGGGGGGQIGAVCSVNGNCAPGLVCINGTCQVPPTGFCVIPGQAAFYSSGPCIGGTFYPFVGNPFSPLPQNCGDVPLGLNRTLGMDLFSVSQIPLVYGPSAQGVYWQGFTAGGFSGGLSATPTGCYTYSEANDGPFNPVYACTRKYSTPSFTGTCYTFGQGITGFVLAGAVQVCVGFGYWEVKIVGYPAQDNSGNGIPPPFLLLLARKSIGNTPEGTYTVVYANPCAIPIGTPGICAPRYFIAGESFTLYFP